MWYRCWGQANKKMPNKSLIANRGSKEPRFSLLPSLVAGIIVASCFVVALYLRIYFLYHQIFVDNWTKLIDSDSYYHLRLVESLLSNSFHRIPFDPYTFFPHGSAVTWPIFFDWLVAGVIWLIGLGSPSQNTINVVSAYVVPVLGSIIVVPVYLIGKILFNRWAGVISAALVAIMPTELFFRSRLGDIDHHAAESLLVSMIILFLILAIRAGNRQAMTFRHIQDRDWGKIGRPLLYSLFVGVFIGCYLLTWVAGLFLVFCLFLCFIILSVHDHLRGYSTNYIAIIGFISMSIGAGIALPFLPASWLSPLVVPSLAIAALTPLALGVISNWMKKRNMPKAYYLLALLGFGIAGVAFLFIINPALLKSMLGQLGSIFRTGGALTISEARPILFTQGRFSLELVWHTYTTGSFMIFIGLSILLHSIIKQAEPDKILLLVWTLVMLVATLAQVRFGYYLAVNVALFSGYAAWNILRWSGFDELRNIAGAHKKTARDHQKQRFKIRSSQVLKIAGIIIVSFLVLYPNIPFAISSAKSTQWIEKDTWHEALIWLKEQTPDPFTNPDFYYDYYETPPPGQNYAYPDTAYGVMAPWARGHEITQISHRIPIANPFQNGADWVARYFASQDEVSANQLMDKLRARYVMVDEDMTWLSFSGTIAYGGYQTADYFETYYVLQDGKLTGVDIYYPEYFRSMVVRLFSFDGQEVAPQGCWVISYEEKMNADGSMYKQVMYSNNFSTYEEASAFVAKQKTGNFRIGSNDFNKSPVYLTKLDHYELVYRSGPADLPEVKIFSYSK
jgi:oligosaccharyl transferase (archaeosortase A-associated)